MNRLVLDASVCLKWFLPGGLEQDADTARALQAHMLDGELTLVEPPIWRSEVASVLARKAPAEAARLTDTLMRIEARIENDPLCMSRAVELSIRLNHHLFDTIYHAVAIEHGIDLVTADEHYYRKARGFGSIVLSKDWRWKPQGVSEPRIEYMVKPRRPRKTRSR